MRLDSLLKGILGQEDKFLNPVRLFFNHATSSTMGGSNVNGNEVGR